VTSNRRLLNSHFWPKFSPIFGLDVNGLVKCLSDVFTTKMNSASSGWHHKAFVHFSCMKSVVSVVKTVRTQTPSNSTRENLLDRRKIYSCSQTSLSYGGFRLPLAICQKNQTCPGLSFAVIRDIRDAHLWTNCIPDKPLPNLNCTDNGGSDCRWKNICVILLHCVVTPVQCFGFKIPSDLPECIESFSPSPEATFPHHRTPLQFSFLNTGLFPVWLE